MCIIENMEEEKNTTKDVELSVGGFENLEDLDWELITVTHTTIDRILKQDKPLDLLGVYMFYVYTAKWQKTWQIKATTGYVAKGLGISEDKVRKAKQRLGDLGFVEDHQTKNKLGKVTGHYIKLKYPCNVKPTPWETQTVGNQETNAYNTSNINAYNIITNLPEDKSPVKKKIEILKDSHQFPPIPVSIGTTPATRLYALYLHLFNKKYGQVTRVNEYRNKSILKKLSTEIGEYKVALSIILFMNWKGANGQDKFIETLLANSCHDIVYLPKNITPILAYAQNKLGVKESDIISTVNSKIKEYGLSTQ